MTWRPIETAPRDTCEGEYFILVVDAKDPQFTYAVVYEGWQDDDGGPVWFDGDVRRSPTHWMPLPSLPTLAHGGLEVPDA